MSSTKEPISQIRQDASRWADKMIRADLERRELTEFEHKSLTAWVGRSAEHYAEFQRALLERANVFDGEPETAEARSAWLQQDRWRSIVRVPRFDLARLAIAASVVTVAVTLGVLFLRGPQVPWEHFEATGDHFTTLKLSDRSRVSLYPGASAEVRIARSVRSVRLLRGGASFSVTHDSDRPFEIAAGSSGVVKVLGTVFDVRVGPHETLIDVVEGQVHVAGTPAINPPITTSAGSKARILPNGWVESLDSHVSPNTGTQAVEGSVPVQRSLGQLAEEYNRGGVPRALQVFGRACERAYVSGGIVAQVAANGGLVEVLSLDDSLVVLRAKDHDVVRERGDVSMKPCLSDGRRQGNAQ